MTDSSDADLLAQFARDRSEAAFTSLVERHIGVVHSVALRHTARPEQAQDITQAVFIILARKAASLGRKTILSGWLYHTARLTAANFRRAEMRRVRREQEAYMQSTLNEPGSSRHSGATADALWLELSPLLDDAMARLRAGDRDALVLRYFENKSLAEVGAAMGLAERAAQKRVIRAVEKLRKMLAARGVTNTSEQIAETISGHSVQSVAPELAKAVTATALAKGATASTSILTLTKGALKVMAWTKAKTIIVAAAAVILTAGVSTVLIEKAMLIDGKTESQWIQGIVYWGDEKQTRQWRALGPRGVRMLVRALKSPASDRGTKMKVAFLLGQLGNDAKGAIPELISQLKVEKEDDVRQIEMGYFEGPFKNMPDKDKAALFPEVLRALESQDPGLRNNALVILQYYTDKKETIVPRMTDALQDPDAGVRLMAVKALIQTDPRIAARPGIVPIVVDCVTNENTANDAVHLLGDLHREPDLAVPVLVKELQSDDRIIRNNAASALGKFGGQARAALPALTNALADPDRDVRLQAASALKKINASR